MYDRCARDRNGDVDMENGAAIIRAKKEKTVYQDMDMSRHRDRGIEIG